MSAAWITAYVALAFLVVLLAVLVLGTLRRISGLLERAEMVLHSSAADPGGLEVGDMVPDFEAATTSGARFTAEDLEGHDSLVVLVDRDCPPCRRLLDSLAAESTDLPELYLVFGERTGQADVPNVPVGTIVVVQVDGSVSRAFRSGSTPHTFLLRGRQVVASGTPNTAEGLRNLALRLREEVREPNREAVEA